MWRCTAPSTTAAIAWSRPRRRPLLASLQALSGVVGGEIGRAAGEAVGTSRQLSFAGRDPAAAYRRTFPTARLRRLGEGKPQAPERKAPSQRGRSGRDGEGRMRWMETTDGVALLPKRR